MTRDKITPKRGGPRVPCRAPRGVPRAVSSIPGIMIHLCRITAGASPHPSCLVVAKSEVGVNKKVVVVVVTQG
jgi:hypothetical protein